MSPEFLEKDKQQLHAFEAFLEQLEDANSMLFFRIYRVSSYSFRGNYSFLSLEIQRSQYIRPKVTVHKAKGHST